MAVLRFTQHLSLDGLGVTTDANVDGSVTPQYFELRPSTEHLEVHRIIVLIGDATPISAETYGAVPTLTNGVLVDKVRGTGAGATLIERFTDVPIVSNVGWGQYCYDTKVDDYGAGDNYVGVRWTLAKAGEPLFLDAGLGDTLRVTIQDDLTGLTEHSFVVEGLRRG